VTCFADVRASGQDRTHPHALSFRKGATQQAEKSPPSGKGSQPTASCPKDREALHDTKVSEN